MVLFLALETSSCYPLHDLALEEEEHDQHGKSS